ncbi:6-hydroxymethylpterin diphosphokinase MptE-like protein [Methylomonas sp. 2BW1-5-20]|uniref:6-hydroxymethylpterin diphosphokinase MptE-like protein n=1 Tax=Methylomonas sp. 2BW1-5-20 TaxID=3376686 RepID=UPI004052CC9D
MTDPISLVDGQLLGPLTINSFGDSYFFNLNRHAFDKVSAGALFDTKFGEILFKEDELNIVVGTDSGMLLRYIQSRPLPKGTRYIFIEPDSVLLALKAYDLLGELDERIVCVNPDDWPRALQNFKVADYFYIDAVKSVNAFCAEDDFINEYAELSWHITEVLSQLNWRYSAELGTEAFMSRQIHNVADNRMPAKLLAKAFSGRTVAILAGGPSLDQALPWIKQHRQQLAVFAVSRISRQLLAAGIEPDFVFSVDPTELSFDISKEMLSFSDKTIFVCSHHAVPTLVSQWTGTLLYLGSRLPWQSDLNVKNLSSAGPTVTNTALNVAYEFGFSRMILIGVDLCFTREGFTHAKGSDEQLAGPRFNLTSLQVETNAGFMAPTSCDFAQAIQSLARQAQLLNNAGCRLINVAEGAAKIKDIEYQPLSALQLDSDVFDIAAEAAEKLNSAKDQFQNLDKVADELRRAQYQVRAIAKLSANARQINDAMYNTEGAIVSFYDKKKLDQIEKKFKREHRQFSKLVKKFGIRSLIKLAKPFEDEDWSAEEARQLGNVYYNAYAEGANKLLGLIDAAIERVNARRREADARPDFPVLVEQAQKDRGYGRVRLWRKRFSSELLSPDVGRQFDDLDARFAAVISDRNTRHMARAKDLSNLAAVKKRAGLLFKHNKTAELADLRSALVKHEQQEAAISYRFLVEGYLAELDKQFDAALDAYQQIVDIGDGLLEEALARIASIGVERDDAQTAKLALECLSQLNPVYLPLFAEAQRLHGDMVSAIDSYAAYIGQFPRDILVQMKLAALYGECEIYEGAEMMLDYILQQRPDYEAAIVMRRHLSEMKDVGSALKNSS